MFTWICPTCGREVPPAYDECPDCAAKAKSGAPPGPQVAQPAPPPAAPVAPAPPPPPQSAPAYVLPAPRAALPTWLLATLFAVALVALGGILIWFFHGSDHTRASAVAPSVAAPAGTPAAPAAKVSEMQKYIEVSGVRFVENAKKQTEARFVVINHSGADIADLAGSVDIFGRAGKSEQPAGNFSFKLASLGPYESKEATAPLTSNLKVYELPDWQFITTEVHVTSP